MKVRCIHLMDSRGKTQERSAWLTIGKTYHVLEVIQDIHHRWLIRLVGDGSNGVALFPSEQFQILSSQVSPTWRISLEKNGYFALSPAAWSQPGFWDRYYDREPNAVRIFEDEMGKIIEADP